MKRLFTLVLILPLGARAQAPTLTATAPARHTASAPRTGPLTFTFSQPVTGVAGLRVLSSNALGSHQGTTGGDGTATLTFQPQRAFMPGEHIRATVPATVQAATGGTALAAGQVLEYRAAAGRGTGTFTSRPPINGIYASYNPILADVNSDGRLDLLYGNIVDADILLHLGDGQGGFGSSTRLGSTLEPSFVTTGDFNEDGKLDLVAVGYRGGGYWLTMMLGNGQGGFTRQAGAEVNVPAIPFQPHVADVNADGHDDIVFLDHAPSGLAGNPVHTTLHVRLGNGQGGFTGAPDVALPAYAGVFALTMKLSDLNNDGRLDVLVDDLATGQAPYLGDGLGGFAQQTSVAPALSGPVSIVADLNGDGIPDAVAKASGTTLGIYFGTGQGGFNATPASTINGRLFAFSTSTVGQAADLDGDGDLDMLVPEDQPGAGSVVKTRVWVNNGTGSFTANPTLINSSGGLAIGDVNNDGALDIAGYDVRDRFIGIELNTPLATAPTLTSFTPATGAPGTLVTLTGTNFTGASTVLLGGVPVSGFTVVSGTSITFTVPAGSTGGLVSVITPAGTATSTTAFSTPVPTLISVAPTAGLVGSSVVLTGTNLTGTTTVSFNGTAATTFTVTSATSITVTVPAGASTGPITVTTPNGTASSSPFTVLLPPTITSLAPTAVPAGGTVTITGTSLTGATAVTLGGTPITGFTVTAAGTITFTLPAGSTGGVVTVTTPGGTATSPGALTVLQAPTITSFTPASAPANTAVSVTVTGTNFGGATAVTVGGITVTGFTVNASTGALTFTLPAGSAGGFITVTTPGGTATSATALTIVLGARPAASLPVQVYPNPAHTTVYVSRPAGNTAPLHAALYNSLGQLVRSAVLPARVPALDVSGLAAGIYTLRLTTGAASATHRVTVE